VRAVRSSLWPLGLYRVAGDSMRPTYAPSDILLGRRWFTPRPSDIVVAHHHGRPIIKRIVSIGPDQVWLEGDNPAASTDSRNFGAVPISSLEAKIIAKLG
jgi:phage repressor protein C with HTH and peptisase S24 domain